MLAEHMGCVRKPAYEVCSVSAWTMVTNTRHFMALSNSAKGFVFRTPLMAVWQAVLGTAAPETSAKSVERHQAARADRQKRTVMYR
jgi:hypothetical protein